MVDAGTVKERLLGEGPDSPLAGLADLSLDALFAARVDQVVHPDRLAAWAHAALTGWCASADARPALERGLEEAVRALEAEPRAVAQVLPGELSQALLELAGRPFSPDKRLVLKLIDQKPLRDRIRELLVATLTDFTARAPGAGMARGLTGLAKFAAGQARARTGGLGALVGAVTDEVSGQVEKRSEQFADAALAGVLAEIADIASNPARAQQAADIRVALLEGSFALAGPQLARELVNLDVPGGAEVLREAVRGWLKSPAARPALERLAQRWLEPEGSRTVGELARDWGQEAALRTHLKAALVERFAFVVRRPGFDAWLVTLLGPDGAH